MSGERRGISKRGRSRRVAGLAMRVGASYGRAALSRALGLAGEDARSLAHADNAARVLETALVLRGPFMKLLQLWGMQGDILPEEYLNALSTLHDQAPPLPWEEVRPVLEAELGSAPETVFRTIDPQPIAAASLGQVYAGELPGGTRVAIKVQYPGVREAVEADLRAVGRIINAQKRVGADLFRVAGLDHRHLFDDLASRLREEVDYRREAANVEVFRTMYRDWPWVQVPRVYREFSTDRVLTMDLLEGTPFGPILRGEVEISDDERETLRFRLAEMIDHEYYGVGIVHADPHPGNKLLGPGGEIRLLDFGCIKVIPRGTRDTLRDCVRTLLAGDDDALLAALTAMGLYREGLDPRPAVDWWKFSNWTLLVDGPIDGTSVDYRKELFDRLGELSRRGYVHFPPHTLFLLRGFFGIVATFRALGKKSRLNYRRRTIDFFARRLGEGDRIREDLERRGLVSANG